MGINMILTPLSNIVPHFADDNNRPLAGGRLSAYLAGTSTPTPFYDESGTNLGVSILLDARGEPPTGALFLQTGLKYKFRLEDRKGSQIWEIDQINASTFETQEPITSFLDADSREAANGILHTVQHLPNYDALRALKRAEGQTSVFVEGHTVAGDGGSGTFWYDASDTTSVDNGGTVIVGADGGRWKRIWSGPVDVRWFGAVGGDESADSGAVQAAIDAGYRHLWLPTLDSEYELSGLTFGTDLGHGRDELLFEGESRYSTAVAVRGVIMNIGNGTNTLNGGLCVRNMRFNVYEDLPTGALRYHRVENYWLDNVFVYEATLGKIGSFLDLNDAYLASFRNIYGSTGGISFLSFYNTDGGRTLDTLLFSQVWWTALCFAFFRGGMSNLHGVSFENVKLRIPYDDPGRQDTGNQGETRLSNAMAKGATSCKVNSIATLRKGNLASGDVIYVGYGESAEMLRVQAVAGTTITTTPALYAHATGDPVVYGPVFITTERGQNFRSSFVHMEGGYIPLHLNNIALSDFSNIYATSRVLARVSGRFNTNTMRTLSINNYPDPLGWSQQYVVEFADYGSDSGEYDNQIEHLYLNPYVSSNFEVYKDLGSRDYLPILNFQPTRSARQGVSGSMNIDWFKFGFVYITLHQDITSFTFRDGQAYDQEATLLLEQQSGGSHTVDIPGNVRLVGGSWGLPSAVGKRARYTFRWDGSNWVEASRSVGM